MPSAAWRVFGSTLERSTTATRLAGVAGDARGRPPPPTHSCMKTKVAVRGYPAAFVVGGERDGPPPPGVWGGGGRRVGHAPRGAAQGRPPPPPAAVSTKLGFAGRLPVLLGLWSPEGSLLNQDW